MGTHLRKHTKKHLTKKLLNIEIIFLLVLRPCNEKNIRYHKLIKLMESVIQVFVQLHPHKTFKL